jgi:actin related protein 2/3 complex subunit 3
MAILPIRTRIRGPAPVGAYTISHLSNGSRCSRRTLSLTLANPEQADILDETLDLFRANSLFRNFEIKGPADRLLIVLILFISDCLAKLGNAKTVPTQIEASKLLNTLSVDNFPIPGDANFPLNAHYAAAASRADSGGFNI